MSEVTWQRDPEFIGANHAEHAMVGDYELLVFDLPADRAGPADKEPLGNDNHIDAKDSCAAHRQAIGDLSGTVRYHRTLPLT